MSRFVIPARQGLVAAVAEPPDGPGGRIVKYVPADIVSIFTMVVAGLISVKIDPRTAAFVVVGLIAVFFIGTIAFMAVKAPPPVRNAHLIVSPLAFLAWAYPVSSVLLGAWFIGWAALVLQAIVLLLALIIAPQQQN